MRTIVIIGGIILAGATTIAVMLDNKKEAAQHGTEIHGAPGAGGTSAGLNPEHGQPGHRCDLPVGAPLTGTSAPVGLNPDAAISSEALPQPAANLPKTNPEHGLPGHRCDIPVGADLTAASPAATPQTIDLAPPVQQSSAPATGNLKANPAHGQPGHRCDIAVGAPL